MQTTMTSGWRALSHRFFKRRTGGEPVPVVAPSRIDQCRVCDELHDVCPHAPVDAKQCIDCGDEHHSLSNRCWTCRTRLRKCTRCGEKFRSTMRSRLFTCAECRVVEPPATYTVPCSTCNEEWTNVPGAREQDCPTCRVHACTCRRCGVEFRSTWDGDSQCRECSFTKAVCACGNEYETDREYFRRTCLGCVDERDCDTCGDRYIHQSGWVPIDRCGDCRKKCIKVKHECADCGGEFLAWRTSSRMYCNTCRNKRHRKKWGKCKPKKAAYNTKTEKNAAAATRRRQRVSDASTGGKVTADHIAALRAGTCVYCGSPAHSADHIRPLYRGGHHRVENLVPACRMCNEFKGTLLLIEMELKRPDLVIHACLVSSLVMAEYAREKLGGTLNGPDLPPLKTKLTSSRPSRSYSCAAPRVPDLHAALRAARFLSPVSLELRPPT